MDNEKHNVERSEKELYAELVKVLDEVDVLSFSNVQFAEQLASAENLGLQAQIETAQLKMMFAKQKAFYLHLRYNRVFNLLIQKCQNYASN